MTIGFSLYTDYRHKNQYPWLKHKYIIFLQVELHKYAPGLNTGSFGSIAKLKPRTFIDFSALTLSMMPTIYKNLQYKVRKNEI